MYRLYYIPFYFSAQFHQACRFYGDIIFNLATVVITRIRCVRSQCCAASSTPSTTVAARRIWRKQFSQSAQADHVPGYAHLPPHRWTTLYHGCARSSASVRSHMRVLPHGTLCPTTSAPRLIVSSSENCLNHSILVKLLTFVDFCVSLCALASGWLL